MAERAVALATILLTRHPGVLVTGAPDVAGYDLSVYLTSDGKPSSRMFAVELKGRLSLPRLGRIVDAGRLKLSSELRLALEKQQRSLADLTFPLLFIVFAMDSDRGFYGWLRQPVLGRSARVVLSPEIAFAQEWRQHTHEEIVDTVNQWYDAAPTHAKRTG